MYFWKIIRLDSLNFSLNTQINLFFKNIFIEEFPKEAEDARKVDQKRRGTLAQLLLGDKQSGKSNTNEATSSGFYEKKII